MEHSKRIHLLLLDQESRGPGLLEEYLEKAGFEVESYSETSTTWTAFVSAPPRILLLNIPSKSQSTEEFLKQLRQHPAGEELPVILMSSAWQAQDAKILSLVREHHLHSFLHRPFALLDLPDLLRKALRNPPRKTVSTSGRPERKAFNLLLEIWQERRTGVLRLEQADNWALFSHGAPVDAEALGLATRGLYEGGVRFRHTSQDSQGEIGPFARILWKAALSLTSRAFSLRRDRLVLKPSNLLSRITEFTPSEFTLQCFGGNNSQKRVDTLMLDAGENADDLCLELGALKVLGLLDFEEVAARQTPRKSEGQKPAPKPRVVQRPTPEPEEARPPKQEPAPTPQMPVSGVVPVTTGPQSHEDVHRRLKREHASLKNADHYTILGVDPKASQEMITAFSERMQKRYQDILNTPDYGPEIHDLARDIKRWVDNAADLLAKRETRSRDESDMTGYADASMEEMAFQEGQAAMEAGLYERAAQCFTRARNERLDSARNLAWLGWATYHDPDQDITERVNEALEFLRLASSFDPHHKDGQYFLAFIEGKHGNVDQAIKRLEGLLLDDKGNTVARVLLSELRRNSSS